MSKLIEEGLEFIGFDIENVEIKFLTQSCFPIYQIYLPKKNQFIAVKILDKEEMALSEISSLKYLKEKNCFVPTIHGMYSKDKHSLIYMDFIKEESSKNKKEKLLSALRILYSNENAKWGFGENNYIGALSQRNSYHDSFDSFYWANRLEPQLKLCLENKVYTSDFINKAERFFIEKSEEWKLNSFTPRLIHGDLWNGNVLFSENAYFIDPSIAYSHPEQDLAMLALFGSPISINETEEFLEELGFSPDFKNRIPFWQLYPLLVHVNLFGGSYIQAVRKIVPY